MPTRRAPTQARAVATRHAILVAAASVFDERGYDGATIGDILDASGITKGALYFHFESKRALADAIVAEQGSWLASARISGLHPVQEVVQVSHRFVRALQEDPLVRASIRLTVEYGTFDADGAASYRTWLGETRENYARAKRLGDLQDHLSPTDAAYATTSMVTGLQLVTHALSNRRDLDRRLTATWRILLPALVTAEALDRITPGPGVPGRGSRRAARREPTPGRHS